MSRWRWNCKSFRAPLLSTQGTSQTLKKAHNRPMKYNLLFGWGIIIYAIMFLVWSGFVTYGFIEGLTPKIATLLVLIGVTALAGQSLRYRSWTDILPYSLGWVVIMAILDGIFSVPYSGFSLYLDPNIWFGYAVVAIVPLISPYLRLNRTSGSSTSL